MFLNCVEYNARIANADSTACELHTFGMKPQTIVTRSVVPNSLLFSSMYLYIRSIESLCSSCMPFYTRVLSKLPAPDAMHPRPVSGYIYLQF